MLLAAPPTIARVTNGAAAKPTDTIKSDLNALAKKNGAACNVAEKVTKLFLSQIADELDQKIEHAVLSNRHEVRVNLFDFFKNTFGRSTESFVPVVQFSYTHSFPK